MSASLQIACPNCSKSYRISNESMGKVVRCRSCQRSFKIDPENSSTTVASKPSLTENEVVPPPLPSVKQKTNKALRAIIIGLVLAILAGGVMWIMPKSQSQKLAEEQALIKPLVSEFEQAVAEAHRRLKLYRDKQAAVQIKSDKFKNAADKIEAGIDGGLGDPKKLVLAVVMARSESTRELLAGVALVVKDLDKLRMFVVNEYSSPHLQLIMLEANKKISKGTLEVAIAELDKLKSQWNADVDASK